MALRKTKSEAFPPLYEDLSEAAIWQEIGQALKAKDDIVKWANSFKNF